jgi:histone acetyltransferase (RNA polymerase elongator complex component)
MKIYPIFLPHLGCPHRCAYCSLIATIGEDLRTPTPDEVSEMVSAELTRSKEPFHVAFYGGSFTALPIETQLDYLDAVNSHNDDPLLDSIRISTRPDAIDEEILNMLKSHNVSTIELGVETLNDEILGRIKRGHSARDSERALILISDFSLTSIAQLMYGLPGEDKASFINNIKRIIIIRPDFVRLHPTLIFRGTGLEEMHKSGEYDPLSLETAIEWGVDAYNLLTEASIGITRFGLHEVWTLKGEVVAGPYHPAFGELVISQVRLNDMLDTIEKLTKKPDDMVILVNKDELSQFIGHKGVNIKYLENILGVKVKFKGVSDMEKGTFCIEY